MQYMQLGLKKLGQGSGVLLGGIAIAGLVLGLLAVLLIAVCWVSPSSERYIEHLIPAGRTK